MTTTAQLESALKDAMRSRDEVRKRTLRMTLSAIRLVEIDKGKPLDEQGILAVLQKEVKSRQEAISEAQHAGRPELQAEAEAEIQVLENYLPQQLSDEELETLAQRAIAEVGATSAREMGQVMQVLVPRLQGRASGGQASQAVRKLLESS